MIFKVSGDKKSLRGAVSFKYYVEAANAKAATDAALEADPDILSWSAQELIEVPDDAYLNCPECPCKIRNPLAWLP
tara:strand:+ start:859 stop:1086 length:228 start_codon:yes stop_codon:yes gene_type:complete